MELYPEDEHLLRSLVKEHDVTKDMVGEVLRVLKGDTFMKEPGLIEQFKEFQLDMEIRLAKVENVAKRNTWILLGIGVGAAIASLIFGVMTIQQLKQIIK